MTGRAPLSSLGWAALFVPSAYFVQGLPYNVVTQASQLWLQDAGISTERINLALGGLMLVWAMKPLWAPLVDAVGTKRGWLLGMQALLAALVASLGLVSGLTGDALLLPAAALLWVVAVASATHDTALDGFYMLALPPDRQALFSGVRVAAWRLAMIFAGGALVFGVGKLQSGYDVAKGESWRAGFVATGVLLGLLAAFHAWVLPRPAADGPAGSAGDAKTGVGGGSSDGDSAKGSGSGDGSGGGSGDRGARSAGSAGALVAMRDAALDWALRPDALRLLGYILLARLAESFLTAGAKLFLRAPRVDGGLGLSLEDVGIAYNTVGAICAVTGGILGGALIARVGLARALWPLTLALHVPDVVFLLLASLPATPPLVVTSALVGLEQLGYGLGTGAYAVVLLRAAAGPSRTTHYAISTGLMTLSASLAQMASGPLVTALGWRGYMAFVCVVAVPGALAALWVMPREGEGEGALGGVGAERASGAAPSGVAFTTSYVAMATPERTFDQICDLSQWFTFRGRGPIPGIVEATLPPGASLAVGARIRVQNTDGSIHHETVTRFERGRAFSVRMELSRPASLAVAGIDETVLLAPAPEGTRVERTFALHARSPLLAPLVWLVARTFLRPAVEANNGEIAARLAGAGEESGLDVARADSGGPAS